MDIFNAFATDLSKEDNGVECPYGDAVFMIARANNTAYNKIFMDLYEKHRETIDRKDDEADRISKIIDLDVMSKAVLVGWSGNVTYQGQALEFSVANARTLLAIKDFRAWVMKQANTFELYRAVKEEADVKKSENTSSGASSGEVVSNGSTTSTSETA